ncbi:MAG: IS630 family transposase, partial [Desulfovibrio sp.]|nr:IS630 family transposase [Desulfovibrio sp.]MDR3362895.1 IS630 family transposase [Desulfovibrio sp.]
ESFICAYNETAKPFVWRKRDVKGSQLRNNARNFNN